MNRATLHTEIEIQAAPEHVWQTLTDFVHYPRWNPFIVQIEGQPVVGTQLKARIKLTESRAMTLKPTVVESLPNREFRWSGRLLLPGLMDAEHSFRIEPIDNRRVRFVHSETFRGLLVPLFLQLMKADTLAAFNAMNQALKQRVEQITAETR